MIDTYEKIMEFKKVHDSLEDEESKNLYRALMLKALLGRHYLYETLLNMNIDFGETELDQYGYFKNGGKKVILYGTGYYSLDTYYQVKAYGYEIVAFCDSKCKDSNTVHLGIPVVSPDELLRKFNDCFVVVASRNYSDEIVEQLIQSGFSKDCIHPFSQEHLYILNTPHSQYFEKNLISFSDKEVFLDCGAFDGQTVADYISASEGKYSRIIAFEPSKRAYIKLTESPIARLDNVELVNTGVWSKSGMLNFDESIPGSSSFVFCNKSNSRDSFVPVTSIDDYLNGDKVTFIKMDIEGAELEALKGASDSIVKNRPKLAICIYHKQSDLVEIPLYIKSLVPDYHFYVRCYTPYGGEVVLYAL